MNYMQKRAALNKLSTLKKAAAAVLLVKLANADTAAAAASNSSTEGGTPDKSWLSGFKMTSPLWGMAGGAALGGLTGGILSNDKDRLRNILLGTLGMGGLGYGAGWGYDQLSQERENQDRAMRDADSYGKAYPAN